MAKIEKRAKPKFGGLQAQKFQYDIDVISASAMPPRESIYVFLTRGPKVAMTKETLCDDGGQALWGERLSLMCTMYRSANGTYQEKSAKLCCKEKKKRKTVGEIRLNLGDFTGIEESQTITYQLQPPGVSKKSQSAASVGELTVTITSKFIAPNSDDAPSDMSDMSGIDDTSQMSFGDAEEEDDEFGPTPVDGAVSQTAAAMSPAVNKSEETSRSRIQALEEQLAERDELISDLRRQNTDLTIAASGTSTVQQSTSDSLDDAQKEILRLQTAHRDSLQSETVANESAAELKEQLRQAKIELEAEQRDKSAAVSKMQLESQTQIEQQQELEREHEKAQAENERLRTEADATQKLLYQQIEELRSQLSGDSPTSPNTEASESGQGLEKHLQEMLEMRGQELDEAKKRLQNFKDKLKDCQESLDTRNTEYEELASSLAAEQAHHAAALQLKEKVESELADSTAARDSWTSEKTEMQKTIDELQQGQSNSAPEVNMEEMYRLEGMLIEAKMGWAQSEEDKSIAELKLRQLRDQVNKGRELNLQFAKRMTKLEVKLSKAKEGKK